MDKKFIATVVPNGIIKRNGQDNLLLSVCVDINHNNSDIGQDPLPADTVTDFYKSFMALLEYLHHEPQVTISIDGTAFADPSKPAKFQLTNKYHWTSCGIADTKELENIRRILSIGLFGVSGKDTEQIAHAINEAKMLIEHVELAALRTDFSLGAKSRPVTNVGRTNLGNTIFNNFHSRLNDVAGHSDFRYSILDANGLASQLKNAVGPGGSSGITALLAGNRRAADASRHSNRIQKADFVAYLAKNRQHNSEQLKNVFDFSNAADEAGIFNNMIGLSADASNAYVDSHIDLQEIFITLSQLNHHPVLLRLFHLVMDFEIPLHSLPNADRFNIAVNSFEKKGAPAADAWLFNTTPIVKYAYGGADTRKLAFLVAPQTNYFLETILDDSRAYIINFDPVAQEQKLLAAKERSDNNNKDIQGEFHDSFTRGIIYNHPDLNLIIQPPKDPDPLKPVISEEHISMGTRVAMKKVKDNGREWISLTKRSTLLYSVRAENKVVALNCGDTESCIQFDHATNYMDETSAAVGYKSSDALFEFKGELLTLNTIFSRETKRRKIDQVNDSLDNPPDISLEHSQKRLNKHLDIDYYPYDGKVRPDISPSSFKLRYGLPDGNPVAKKLPSLQFGESYQFVLYYQYRNGWALPLHTGEGLQASLPDVIGAKRFKLPGFNFKRLENIKPVLLFPQKKISTDPNANISETDSIKHMIIRDSVINDKAFRHVLPERISLEHAYWFNLLFQMDKSKRFQWKCRYNCALDDASKFSGKCDEGCTTFCGGTKMADVYPGAFIKPEEVAYIPDPLVDGFIIQVYWDKQCSHLIDTGNIEAVFEKKADFSVQSYGLQLSDNTNPGDNVAIRIDNSTRMVEIAIKKGMTAYARLFNHTINVSRKNKLGHDYWINQLKPGMDKIVTIDHFKDAASDPKNQPVIVTLTNAVKLPLLPPRIFEFGSAENEVDDNLTRDPLNLDHVTQWIQECEVLLADPNYPCKDAYSYLLGGIAGFHFTIGPNNRNIISLRPPDDKSPYRSMKGSSYIQVQLTALFERLDAINENEFLTGTSPTGGLEFWSRQEEFMDDSTQKVLAPTASGGDRITHDPEKPLFPFSNNKKNTPKLSHKLTFDDSVLRQLQDPLSLQDFIDSRAYLQPGEANDRNYFRNSVSKVDVTYNSNSTKFGIHRFVLRDYSRFKGYFTNEVVSSKNVRSPLKSPNFNLEDFYLESKEFPVMVLNNQNPDPPEVAYAITTIQETREKQSGDYTKFTQSGNFVTIYLKRNRESSGRTERVGIIVRDKSSKYFNVFSEKNCFSRAGKDIISDKSVPKNTYLTKDNILDPIKSGDINLYDARYDSNLGIWHFLPRFDVEKQLWKFEVSFNIKDSNNKNLHNPFVNLTLVHYQPLSLNYCDAANAKTLNDVLNDCRLSAQVNTTWCYLLPERTLLVSFSKPVFLFAPWGKVDLTVSFDYTSLHHHQKEKGQWEIRSNFLVSVEGSFDRQIWFPVMSQVNKDDGEWRMMHPLLTKASLLVKDDGYSINPIRIQLRFRKKSNPAYTENPNAPSDHSIRFSHFRVRFVEVEWFDDTTLEDFDVKNKKDLVVTDILDQENMRVRYVELIE